MADNATLPAVGSVIAADDVGSALHQLIKVEFGPDGTVNQVEDASGKRLPVLAHDTNIVSITVTRPNDTAVYASGDAIADSTSAPTAFTANGFARVSGGSGRITHLTLTLSTAQSTKANLELWVFDAAYTNNNDNAAWAPSDADADKVIAVVPLGGSPIVGGANCIYEAPALDIPYVCAATALWFALVVRNAYTPTALETFKLRVGVQRFG